MQLNLPVEVYDILKKFKDQGFDIYIVGGVVRDILTGRPTYDWDFTTNAIPEEIQKIFPDSFYDNIYGTVGIPSIRQLAEKGVRPFEITTFRHEYGYSDKRRPDKVVWGKTLEEDLKRRDFTINAMALRAIDLSKAKKSETEVETEFELIDPYNGQSDLKKKLIRAVGDSNERFSEDALRLLRAIRIASELDFTIEENTLNALKANRSLINKIAKERVRDELFKILKSPNPQKGIEIFRNSGLMESILPEMEKTFGVEQKSPQRHHVYDVGTHSLLSLKHCRSENPVVRFASLIHDIGKPQTYKKLESGIITFYSHETVGASIAKRIAERLKFSKKQSERLIKLVRWHQFSVDERQTDSALRRFIRRVGIEDIPAMIEVRVADRLGGGARETSWRLEEFKKRLIEVQKQPFSIKDLKVNGFDVMKILNIGPGPKVGEILEILFQEVVEGKIPNQKEELIKHLLQFKN